MPTLVKRAHGASLDRELVFSSLYITPNYWTPLTAGMTLSANTLYYWPFLLDGASGTLQEVLVRSTSAPSAGTHRIGIYLANNQVQPTSLVADLGTNNNSPTGVYLISNINLSLSGSNLYLIAMMTSEQTTYNGVRGGFAQAWSGAFVDPIGAFKVAYTYGVMPVSPIPWDATPTNTNGLRCPVLARFV